MKELMCIECGVPASSLYKEYSPTVLKLEQCKVCNSDVDKYVEYDNAVVFLDIALQKIPAYRHTLFNSEFKAFWKLGVICIICNAYIKWAQGMKTDKVDLKSREFYLQVDWKFYYMLLQTFIDLGLFMLVTICSTRALYGRAPVNIKSMLQGLLLANYGQLFAIPAVIWSQNQSQAYLWLTEVFIFLSNIQVHRAILGSTLTMAWIAVGPAIIVKILFSFYIHDVFLV